jgi:outer membrane protein
VLAATVLLLVLLAGGARAAEVPASVRRISLQEALAIALRDNRTLRAAALTSEAAQAGVGVARGALVPRLDAGENFSYTNNPVLAFSDLLLQQDFSQSDFALDNLNHPGFISNFQSQVRLSFPLFAGGRLIAAYRAAGFAADAERWQEIRTRQQVEFAVIQAYYSALLAQERTTVVASALAAARAHLKQAQDFFAHGTVVNSDVLRTQVLVGGLEQQEIEAHSQLNISWASLAHTLGDEDQRFAPSATARSLQSAASTPALEVLIPEAIANRPELKIADYRVEQARQAVTIARADYLPTVEIAGVYENDSQQLTRAGNNGALFVTGRLNLFNGLATQAKVNAAQADLSRARTLAADLRHAIALEVESVYRTLAATRQSLSVAERDNAYAQRALAILQDRYGTGLATNVAVLDAQTAREEAAMQLARARVNFALDQAALNLAIGSDPQSQSGR